MNNRTVQTVARPYLITFHATGAAYPLTSVEVDNLLAEYPVLIATRNHLVLNGHNTSDTAQRVTIRPATLGGGPAFILGWRAQ